jgi:hypothetical protein
MANSNLADMTTFLIELALVFVASLLFVVFALMNYCYETGRGAVIAMALLALTAVTILIGLEISAIQFLVALIVLCSICGLFQHIQTRRDRFPK